MGRSTLVASGGANIRTLLNSPGQSTYVYNEKKTNTTNSTVECIRNQLNLLGNTPANNLGHRTTWYIPNAADSSGEAELAAAMDVVMTDGTDTAENCEFQFWTKRSGTLTKVLTVDSSGTLSSDGDLAWTSAATASFIDNNASALVFKEGSNAYMTFDSTNSAERVLFSKDVELADNVSLKFGTGDDIVFTWDGTNLDVTQATANSNITFGVDNAGIDMKWFGDTSGSFMEWDQSADALTFTDDTYVKFGDADDVSIAWNGTNLAIVPVAADTGAVILGADGAGMDLILYGDTAGSNVTWDQSADSLIFTDSTPIVFGDGSDITMQFDATNLKIATAVADTGAVALGANGAGVDLIMYGDTASVNCTWDQSADSLIFNDNAKCVFGTGSDVTIAFDGTDLDITGASDNLTLTVGAAGNSFDLKIFGVDADGFISWDASANDLKFEDSCSLMFGTGAGAGVGNAGDVEIRWDATDLDILCAADDSIIKFGNGTNSFDIWIYGDTANDNIIFDASAKTLALDGIDLYLEDSDYLAFGDGQDITFTWDASKLHVSQAAANSAIHLGASGAGIDLNLFGDTAGYDVTWDQSADSMIFNDNAKLVFGTGSDITARFDGTDLDILGGSDDLVIKWGNGTNSFDMWWYGNTANDNLILDAGANTMKLDGIDLYLEDADSFILGDGADFTLQWDGTYLHAAGAKGWTSAPAPTLEQKGRTYLEIFNDFIHPGRDFDTTNDWTVTEDDAACTQALSADTVNGELVLTCKATTDDNGHQVEHKNEIFKLAENKKLWFEIRCKMAEATQSDFYVGLWASEDLTGVADNLPADGVVFHCEDGDTNIDCGHAAGGANSESNSIGTLDTSYHTYAFYFDGGASGSATITPYVDGVAQTAITSLTFTTGELALGAGVRNGDATIQNILTIDYIKCVQLK